MKMTCMKKTLIMLVITAFMLTLFIPRETQAAKVKLNVSKKTIYVSKSYTLKLKNATGEITWKSSKPEIATVKDGVVRALKAGKTTISAKYKGETYKCKITVKKLKAKYNATYNADIKLEPGLYDKDGKQVKTWADMVYDGDIEMDEGVLLSYCDVTGGIKLRISDTVTDIAPHAFSESELTSIIIPESVGTIGSSAFEWCSYLENITIPASILAIEQYSFSNCTSLKSISIPTSVKSLGQAAFSNCKVLKSIKLPKGVKVINEWTFMNCVKLKTVTLSTATTEIGMGAFKGCAVLSKITIPKTVTEIGIAAFDGCSKLSKDLTKQIKKINPAALSM